MKLAKPGHLTLVATSFRTLWYPSDFQTTKEGDTELVTLLGRGGGLINHLDSSEKENRTILNFYCFISRGDKIMACNGMHLKMAIIIITLYRKTKKSKAKAKVLKQYTLNKTQYFLPTVLVSSLSMFHRWRLVVLPTQGSTRSTRGVKSRARARDLPTSPLERHVSLMAEILRLA